ncbi:MAG: hypothetical protein WD275_05330 [Rhodothermales bacterium]
MLTSGCEFLGNESDSTRDEIFEAGHIEPGLFKEVEYVPLFPFYTTAGDGGLLQSPMDVYVGYDQFLYIVDARGLHVLDVAGRAANFIPIEGGAQSVIQDRRLHVYVTARRDTLLNGRTWNLPVVLHYEDITTGSPKLADTIWHPFDEDSRKFNRPDPIPTDEQVEFTGVAVLPDNSIYVSRRGPVNQLASVILPHNTVLEFDPEGLNVSAINALNPNVPSVRSAINPSDVMTFIHPPQRQSFPDVKHFMITQTPGPGQELQFATLSIKAVVTPDGIVYRPDTEMIGVSGDPDRGDGFIYEEGKFDNPTDMAFAGDGTNYIFVVDSGTDSLYAFTSRGVEGVAPPPGAGGSKPVVVSFGGEGDGALQFDDPNGVTYFNHIVYVADTGNNRLSRFRLNTDFE